MIRSKVLVQLITRQLQNLDSDAVTSSEFVVSRCLVGSVACSGHSSICSLSLVFNILLYVYIHLFSDISVETVSFILSLKHWNVFNPGFLFFSYAIQTVDKHDTVERPSCTNLLWDSAAGHCLGFCLEVNQCIISGAGNSQNLASSL